MQNYELEPESVVEKLIPEVNAKRKKPASKKKNAVAKVTKEKKPALDKELEAKLRSKLEDQLTTELEVKLTTKLTAEIETVLRPKLEAELKTQIEANIRSTLEQEFEDKLKQKAKSGELFESEPDIILETKQKTESESKEPIDFDMDNKQIVEAILFAADKPMTTKQIRNVYPELERPALQEIQIAIDLIIEDYAPRSVGLKQLAGGYTFQVKDGYSYWVSRLFEEKPPRYSRALLETIAIIAYRQPVTRGDIEDIRGVSVSSNIIRTLLEREWIRILGHKEVPGRPALYGTTKQFLDYFNLSSLEQLPPLDEIKDLDFCSGNPLASKNLQNDEWNHNQENVNKDQHIEEQASEKKTSEKQPTIDPISETRH